MLQPMLQVNALRCTFGKGGDPQGVCRVWLYTRSFLTGRRLASSMAWPCDPQAFSQQQSPIRRMELHVAVDFAATHGLGDGLQNWTKQMSLEEFDALTEAS